MSSLISTRSAAKRRRLLKEEEEAAAAIRHLMENRNHLLALPDEIIVRAVAHVGIRDVAVLCRLCKSIRQVASGSAELWRELAIQRCGPVSEEIWSSLRHRVPTSDDNDEPLDDAALWRRIYASWMRSRRRALEEDVDYQNVAEHGQPASEPVVVIRRDWMKPLNDYSFRIHIWKTDGQKLSGKLYRPRFARSSIRLTLSKSSVAKIIRSGEFRALEIEVGCVHGGSAVLYSSVKPLDVYGGGSFQEYSVMPWFGLEEDPDEEDHDEEPGRYAFLPFVSVVANDTSDDSSLPQSTRRGSPETVTVSVEMQWRCRSIRGNRFDAYDFFQGMNPTDILTLLKHRSSSRESKFSEEPRCISPTLGAMLPTQHYTPKSLSAYSFLVEFQNTKNPAKKCSIFYEGLLAFDLELMGLDFEIPTCFGDFFPWGEDYEDQRTDRGWVDIDAVFSVFVIDRRTGMQAKLYESKTLCELEDYFALSYFVEFEKCASLTQFSNVSVPATKGFVPLAYKSSLDDGEKRTFCVYFDFLFCAANRRQTFEFSSEDVLVFLEKGLTYK